MKKLFALLLAGATCIGMAGCNGAESPIAESSAPSAVPSEAPSGEGAAPDSAGASSGAATINFWNGFTGSDGEILTEIVNRYNDGRGREKGIAIKMDIIPWANFHEKLPTAIATGTAPQLVLCGNDMLATYHRQDAFLPMDDYFDVTGASRDDFSQNALDIFMLDGKLWGIPMQVNGMYLYWNKDIFSAAGLDPETPPATWEELGEMAVKTTDAGKNIYGFGIPTSSFVIQEHVIMCNGGRIVDDTNMKSMLDSQVTVDALGFLRNLTMEHKVSPPSTPGADMDNLCFAGQLAMYINGPWMNNGLKRNNINYGVTSIPAGSAGRKGTFGGCSYNVTSGTSDADRQAAYDFVAYWNTTEICKEWSMRNGFPPYLKSVAADPEVAADPIVSELYKSLEYVEPVMRGVTVVSRINDDILFPLGESVLYGGEDPAALVPDASKSIDMLLAE